LVRQFLRDAFRFRRQLAGWPLGLIEAIETVTNQHVESAPVAIQQVGGEIEMRLVEIAGREAYVYGAAGQPWKSDQYALGNIVEGIDVRPRQNRRAIRGRGKRRSLAFEQGK